MIHLWKTAKKLRIVIYIFLLILLSLIIIPLPDPLFTKDYSTVVLSEEGEVLRIFLNEKEHWRLAPDSSASVPVKLETAVLSFEDRYFYYHPGINPVSVVRSLISNMAAGKIRSGASTITMQTARLIKAKERTYFNKLLEIGQAVKIELLYSKEEILKKYLNNAPYGGNIIGYRAASLRYFQKMPHKLTWSEAATLAVLPNAPGLISPMSNPRMLKIKRDRLLQRLFTKAVIDSETFVLSKLESLPARSHPLKMEAAHLARLLKNRYPSQYVFHSTISKKIQSAVDQIVYQYGQRLGQQGIKNCAALVLDNRSGEVKAYVGSSDFFNKESRGEVDGIMAPRSSGSVLKPFLYALSMDEGLLLPQSLIKDIPSYFSSFSPANADLKYRGVVTAHTALTQSLNVPAVRLLNKYGLFSFYDFLKNARVSTLFRPADGYGLPLILGGAEVCLWDMARLYSALANYGKMKKSKLLRSFPQNTVEEELFSSSAAWLTLQMLADVKRPGAEHYWQQYQNRWPLSWKTGTSYGQKDAWAIGVNPQWTIAVWAGNFEGEGNNSLSGAASAGPLLFEIFNYLPKDRERGKFVKPKAKLQVLQLCKDSGFLATEHCRDIVEGEAPLHMNPLALCPWHKTLHLDMSGSRQVCSLCWDEKHLRQRRLIFPPDVSQLLRMSGQICEILPPHRKNCPALSGDKPLQII